MSDRNEKCAYSYTVKRGDSFYLIAQRTGVPLRELLGANPDIPPARLTVGDVLCVPYGKEIDQPAREPECENPETPVPETPAPETPAPETPAEPETCPPNRRTVVQEGQTAGDLQLRYGLSYYTLRTANPDKDIEALKGGDVVCVPERNTACPLPAFVTLKAGETLASAAAAYGLTVSALLRANPCLAPKDFCEGAQIRLPN